MEGEASRQRGGMPGAVASFVLGLASVLLLLRMVTGLPAMFLGLWSLRQLNARNEDTVSLHWGKRFAIGGMVLGAVGCIVSVVGLLSVLLLRTHETSRRMSCANHLRQIGKGVLIYHNYHDEVYPPATVDVPVGFAGFAPWMAEPYKQRLGWMVSVLPFLELPPQEDEENPRLGRHAKLLRRFDPFQPWDAPANREGINTAMLGFLCPSHPSYDTELKPAASHYIGCAGLGTDAAELPAGSLRAGFFGYERFLKTSPGVPDPIPRGQAYTLLAGETTIDNGLWAAGGPSTVRGLDPAQKPYIGPERPFGGMHPGGANFLLADWSVRFYTDRTDPQVIETLVTLQER